jgi:hypothetical protein
MQIRAHTPWKQPRRLLARKALEATAPCPPTDDFGYAPVSLSSDAEMACIRGRGERTRQWSQIAGFRSRTWRSLVRRADSTPIGNDDALCAHAEIQLLIRARCAEDPKGHCCTP